MLALSIFLASTATAAVSSQIKIEKSTINVLNSETLPGNLLPNFLFQQGSIEGGSVGVHIGGGKGEPHPFIPDDTCGDDIFEGAMEDMRSPQLPYLTQDLWTCDRTPEDIPVWTMETDELKVTITPQFAGKVWAIYDKVRERDILYNNRAHQPANIGALKAWAAGGAEWNWSPGHVGHSAFSETEVYLTKVDTSAGPMLRVHEFDRYNGTVWQVDMIIANGSFIAHPRITNPTPHDQRGYWWTCVAVEAKTSTRILTPATHVAETSREPMRDAPWPYFAEAIENSTFKGYDGEWPTDNSYLGNHQLGDMFLRIPDSVYTPYIAHTQEDGYVLVHGHPLNGTKFFTWGDGGPGRFMQDFLAGGGKRQGDYTELQVGPAPTQMQNFPVPKNTVLEWTEWFKGFDGDVSVLRGDDYQKALDEIDTWMKSSEGMTQETVHDWDAFFEKYATVEPSEILVRGQPWGALEEKLLGQRLAPGLVFDLPSKGEEGYEEMLPWMELLSDGTFSDATLSRLPLSYQTTDNWFKVIKESADRGMTWLHALHIAINLIERGDVEEPRNILKQSMELKPNPIAARNLAILCQTYEEAWPHFMAAWEILQQGEWRNDPAYERLTRNLVTEMSFLLQQEGWYSRMEEWVKVVPEFARDLDAFVTLQSKLAIHNGQFSEALEILGANCFPTYASARDDLMDMWNTAQEGLAAQKKGSPLSFVEAHQVRVANPVPENIGCKYASEVDMEGVSRQLSADTDTDEWSSTSPDIVVHSRRRATRVNILEATSVAFISEEQVHRIRSVLARLIELAPVKRTDHMLKARAFILWSEKHPLYQKCDELAKQLQERALALKTLKEAYLRDVVSVKFQLERYYKDHNMEVESRELTSIPSADLRSLVYSSQSEDSSNQLRHTVMKAHLVSQEESKKWTANPWEKSKSYKAFKNIETDGRFSMPPGGNSINLYAPSRHRLFVRYCKQCIGIMTLVEEWNQDVEKSFYRRIEGKTNEELRQVIRNLNEFILEQSKEIENLQRDLDAVRKGSHWFDTWKETTHFDEDMKLKANRFRELYIRWNNEAQMCHEEKEEIRRQLKATKLRLKESEEQFESTVASMKENYESAREEWEAERSALKRDIYERDSLLDEKDVMVERMTTEVKKAVDEKERFERINKQLLASIDEKDKILSEYREEAVNHIESLNTQVHMLNQDVEMADAEKDRLLEELERLKYGDNGATSNAEEKVEASAEIGEKVYDEASALGGVTNTSATLSAEESMRIRKEYLINKMRAVISVIPRRLRSHIATNIERFAPVVADNFTQAESKRSTSSRVASPEQGYMRNELDRFSEVDDEDCDEVSLLSDGAPDANLGNQEALLTSLEGEKPVSAGISRTVEQQPQQKESTPSNACDYHTSVQDENDGEAPIRWRESSQRNQRRSISSSRAPPRTVSHKQSATESSSDTHVDGQRFSQPIVLDENNNMPSRPRSGSSVKSVEIDRGTKPSSQSTDHPAEENSNYQSISRQHSEDIVFPSVEAAEIDCKVQADTKPSSARLRSLSRARSSGTISSVGDSCDADDASDMSRPILNVRRHASKTKLAADIAPLIRVDTTDSSDSYSAAGRGSKAAIIPTQIIRARSQIMRQLSSLQDSIPEESDRDREMSVSCVEPGQSAASSSQLIADYHEGVSDLLGLIAPYIRPPMSLKIAAICVRFCVKFRRALDKRDPSQLGSFGQRILIKRHEKCNDELHRRLSVVTESSAHVEHSKREFMLQKNQMAARIKQLEQEVIVYRKEQRHFKKDMWELKIDVLRQHIMGQWQRTMAHDLAELVKLMRMRLYGMINSNFETSVTMGSDMTESSAEGKMQLHHVHGKLRALVAEMTKWSREHKEEHPVRDLQLGYFNSFQGYGSKIRNEERALKILARAAKCDLIQVEKRWNAKVEKVRSVEVKYKEVVKSKQCPTCVEYERVFLSQNGKSTKDSMSWSEFGLVATLQSGGSGGNTAERVKKLLQSLPADQLNGVKESIKEAIFHDVVEEEQKKAETVMREKVSKYLEKEYDLHNQINDLNVQIMEKEKAAARIEESKAQDFSRILTERDDLRDTVRDLTRQNLVLRTAVRDSYKVTQMEEEELARTQEIMREMERKSNPPKSDKSTQVDGDDQSSLGEESIMLDQTDIVLQAKARNFFARMSVVDPTTIGGEQPTWGSSRISHPEERPSVTDAMSTVTNAKSKFRQLKNIPIGVSRKVIREATAYGEMDDRNTSRMAAHLQAGSMKYGRSDALALSRQSESTEELHKFGSTPMTSESGKRRPESAREVTSVMKSGVPIRTGIATHGYRKKSFRPESAPSHRKKST